MKYRIKTDAIIDKNKDMSDNEESEQEVEVTREVYQALMRPVWREKKRAYRRRLEERDISSKRDVPNVFRGATARNNNYLSRPRGIMLSLDYASEMGFEPVAEDNTEERAIKNMMIEELKQSLNKLESRESSIINMSYYKGYSDGEIASMLGISRARVNQIKNKTLKNLKREMESGTEEDNDGYNSKMSYSWQHKKPITMW